MARRRSRNAPARGGVVVWHDGHQCARHCRAGTGASPESGAPGDTPATPGIDGALLFALSASSQDALRQTAARLADWVDAQGPELAPADLAYTLARRRDTGRCAPPYWPPPPRS